MAAEETAFQALLREVRREVDAALDSVWAEAGAEHGGLGAAVVKPFEAARDLCLRGGKRLRAALVAVGYGVGGAGSDWTAVKPACAAVELLQAYFLIHDDWMDQDRVRRGGPSVHAALEGPFNSQHLGACGAILAGDYTLALATRTLARVRVAAGRLQLGFEQFARMQLDAVVGQKLDVLGDGSNLEQIYRLKTGSYSVQGPLELGRVLGGGAGPSAAELEAFATPLGIAFQLRDDLIGAFAAPTTSGKPVGSDWRAGKRTLLWRLALELSAPAERARIEGVFGKADADGSELAQVLSLVEASGARAEVERRIGSLAERARDALSMGSFDARSRNLLEGALDSLVNRGA